MSRVDELARELSELGNEDLEELKRKLKILGMRLWPQITAAACYEVGGSCHRAEVLKAKEESLAKERSVLAALYEIRARSDS